MTLAARLMQGILVQSARFISRVCHIPPKPKDQIVLWTTRISPAVTSLSLLFLIIFLLAAGINFVLPAIAPIYPNGPRLLDVMAEDFLLSPRKPLLVDRPNVDAFYLEADEELVIRDCTIYTLDFYAPSEMRKYDDTDDIVVQDAANLTMINVTFMPSVSITVRDTAVVTMINCTNYRTQWSTVSKTWLHTLQTEGSITATGNATLRVEGSTIGVITLSAESYVDCTVRDSYVDQASLATAIPPRFVDCLIYELIDRVGTVEVDSTVLGNGSRMAMTVHSSMQQSAFQRGEPLSVTFRLENVGNVTLSFASNGTDKFIISYNESNVWNQTYPYEEPTPPAYHFPPRLDPSHVFEQTLTWQHPPFPPGTYEIRCGFYVPSLKEFIGNSPYSYLFGFCGRYTITISEEEWQG